jgi:hypothetical protein
MRWITGAKRMPLTRGLAVDLDSAGKHDTPHPRLHRGVEQSARDVYVGDDIGCRIDIASRNDVRATGEVHDRIDARERRVPVRGGEVPERHDLRPRENLLRSRRPDRSDVIDPSRRQLRADCLADKSTRASDEDFARGAAGQAHFQPCLLKKRVPLRVKWTICRQPLRAAPPP